MCLQGEKLQICHNLDCNAKRYKQMSQASEKCHISDYGDYDNSGVSVIIPDPYLSKASSTLETSCGFNTFNKFRHSNTLKLYVQIGHGRFHCNIYENVTQKHSLF
jgi:hypothetical protein